MQWFLGRSFENIFPTYFYVQLWTLSGALVLIQGSRCWQFQMFTIYTCFRVVISISGAVVLKKILKHLSYVILYWTLNPLNTLKINIMQKYSMPTVIVWVEQGIKKLQKWNIYPKIFRFHTVHVSMYDNYLYTVHTSLEDASLGKGLS